MIQKTTDCREQVRLQKAERGSSSFEPLIDVNEAARLLGGLHPKTLMRKARTGEVPAYQFARSWFFRASELDVWLRCLVGSTQPTTPAE